ncbi:cytochrome P450 [Streptosporangium carneum]|uniref:Cytochrome P450 n=1 Tax=Streptosporangium carneum TaxID=47481 RepID=A0A9W6I9Q1_9ACTN|nr:cytochrome P450 [Streptosporangium carneum]GLK14223.1 cytochrome P450 [Streptosporangium carneum]
MAQSFPVPRTCPFAPPDDYGRLREEAPLVRTRLPGGDVWLVTRHAEAQQVLTDPRVSTDPMTPGHPMAAFSERPPTEEELRVRTRFQAGQFIDMDPPEHGVYRRMLIPEFTVRRIREMRPGIQETVDLLIDEMLKQGSSADLVEAFGLAVPSLVICRLLGVPYADHDFFQSRTRQLIGAGPGGSEDSFGAVTEIWDYLDGLIAEAERKPGDDLVGRLVTARRETGELSHDALVGMTFLLLVAGHETTANMIPLGVHTLLRDPAQLAALRADPDGWPAAVEELLRYHSIVDWVAFDRVATEDMEIGGQAVRAGEGMFVLGASANRDPRVFDRPDEFDIRRGARNHVAFGYGVHQCLGQNLARAELEIAYRTLFERIPGLRVVGEDDELPFKYDSVIFGLRALPVAW